jgi:hypothetical protein
MPRLGLIRPPVTADVSAQLATKADKPAVLHKSVDYVLSATDSDVFGTGGVSGITLTVPLTTGIRRNLMKEDNGAGAVNVTPSSGTIIGSGIPAGTTSIALVEMGDSVTVISDGTNLYPVSCIRAVLADAAADGLARRPVRARLMGFRWSARSCSRRA